MCALVWIVELGFASLVQYAEPGLVICHVHLLVELFRRLDVYIYFWQNMLMVKYIVFNLRIPLIFVSF